MRTADKEFAELLAGVGVPLVAVAPPDGLDGTAVVVGGGVPTRVRAGAAATGAAREAAPTGGDLGRPGPGRSNGENRRT